MAPDADRSAPGARRVLVVAFHYPPDNTSTGVLRTLKFTQYLLGHGWRSHVISVPVALYPSCDPDNARVLPDGIEVERTWACDVKRALGIRGVYPGFAGVPDRYWPWYFSATRAGLRAVRTGAVQAIYSTLPVPTAHLVGLALKRRTGLPWLADFRDPWVEASLPPLRRRFEARLERAVVTRADRVICNTPAMRRAFLAAYPAIDPGKFVVITNGYDEAELAGIVPRPGPRFRILHAGTLDDENRNPRGLLLGVRSALDRGWLREDDLELMLLGAGRHADAPGFRRDLDQTRLAACTTIVRERIAYREALALSAGADVVVVLSENLGATAGRDVQDFTALQVPVKLYEALRLGRPVLALVSGGAVAELLASTGVGITIAPQDTEAIAASLRDAYRTRTRAGTSIAPAPAAIAAYGRERLTEQLARELDDAVAAPGVR